MARRSGGIGGGGGRSFGGGGSRGFGGRSGGGSSRRGGVSGGLGGLGGSLGRRRTSGGLGRTLLGGPRVGHHGSPLNRRRRSPMFGGGCGSCSGVGCIIPLIIAIIVIILVTGAFSFAIGG